MPDTMTLINSATAGAGGASSFDFTSIPATYTDLLIKISARVTGGAGVKDIAIQYNNDTASNYSYIELVGTGASASSGTATTTRHNTISPPDNTTANTFGNIDIYVSSYLSSTQKTASVDAVTENNSVSTDVQMRIQGWRWSGTSAITSIKIFAPGQTMTQYSTAYLYGIKNS